MTRNRAVRLCVTVAAAIMCQCFALRSSATDASSEKRQMTVRDDIELTLFGDPYDNSSVQFSPDGDYFAVWTKRGRLELNRIENSLRFYRTMDVETFLGNSSQLTQPQPVWVLTFSSTEGSAINGWRWLWDSTGVAFLQGTARGRQRITVADFRKKATVSLTSDTEDVKSFDISDRKNYIYVASEGAKEEQDEIELARSRQISAYVATGRTIEDLLFPDDPHKRSLASAERTFWAVVNGKRFPVKQNGRNFVPEGDFALSPDGHSVVTAEAVPDIPASWEVLYPPSRSPYPHEQIHAGHNVAHEYVQIDLRTGAKSSLTDAPLGRDAGWEVGDGVKWSNDGRQVLLTGTFLRSKDNAPSRPCVALVEVRSRESVCVEELKDRSEAGTEDGFHSILNAWFGDGDQQEVLISFLGHLDEAYYVTRYRASHNGAWRAMEQVRGDVNVMHHGIAIAVKQGINAPPLLVGLTHGKSRVLWDPNPQLRNIQLGDATIYTWKDAEGRVWRGGLYKPVNYEPGRRYPLVIQNHGFVDQYFLPSGAFPTAFAARELAAQGVSVLQVSGGGGNCQYVTTEETACFASAYKAAIKQLTAEGMVDPDRVGIIGFSRTCSYVMKALVSNAIRLRAASVTDGVMLDYLQYILFDPSSESDKMIGAKPFSTGIEQWLRRSPGFNLEKVNTPLLVSGEGPMSLLSMWQPYAGLRDLNKPVDLDLLNTDEHVLSNPAVRMASQGTTVDWFRFWLKDEEGTPPPWDPDRYVRWRKLREMQEANDKKAAEETQKQASSSVSLN